MLLSPLSADLRQLHTLWKDVFGDEDGYIDLFFSGAYFSSHPFAVVENGEVRSVLYLLDCHLQSGGTLYDGYYLYAAATKPQYRRRGLMRSLIEEAKAYIEHPVLRERLVGICEAVLNSEMSVYDIFGQDAIKVRACILLFASVCDIPVFKQIKNKYRW